MINIKINEVIKITFSGLIGFVGSSLIYYFTDKRSFAIASIIFLLVLVMVASIYTSMEKINDNRSLMSDNRDLSVEVTTLKNNNIGLTQDVDRVKKERDKYIAALQIERNKLTILMHVTEPTKEQLEKIKLEKELFND